MTYEYIFKILLLGDPAVGKTSLIVRYVKDSFKSDYMTTLGANFLVKDVELPNNKKVFLQIWDIAGQSLEAKYAASYYAGANGILFVYDVTRENTLQRLPDWQNDVEKRAPKGIVSVLIGNKNDLEIKTTDADREQMAQGLGSVTSFSTSAKENIGVDEAFLSLADSLAKEAERKEAEKKNKSK